MSQGSVNCTNSVQATFGPNTIGATPEPLNRTVRPSESQLELRHARVQDSLEDCVQVEPPPVPAFGVSFDEVEATYVVAHVGVAADSSPFWPPLFHIGISCATISSM